ncbi:hypothetical protein HPO96_03475 [Kribbella sandramycini]|uniref:Uncharacterized protein n=1 Tax=Kribbella sandramycini TaxID=60450 RepID=A0A7Y4KVC3_9ACTN|nr:hypothetical protein [Kribbella sandramycini]MBB6568108.1 hypothetical protein [Kribbella sandramycini]NOL39298.1 hypothetical protein [Kribbella sandramycini]
MTAIPSVESVRQDLAAILTRFRAGQTRAFSFGNGSPEAVMLTYDEFDDLGGDDKFPSPNAVLTPAELALQLPDLLHASSTPTFWGAIATPEAVLMSAPTIAN